MASAQDLGKEYAEFLLSHRTDPNAATEIAKRIGELTYVGSGAPISKDDIRVITEAMKRHVIEGGEEYGFKKEAEDSREMLNMIDMIYQHVTKGK